MTALLLVDNDVLLKAAHWDLLDFVPGAAGATWEQVAVLPQLIPRVRRFDPKLIRDHEAARRLLACLERCMALPAPDAQLINTLQGVPGIDAGELVLLGALAAAPHAALLTGDKRALRLLATPTLRECVGACAGRLLCVDTWLVYVLRVLGAEAMCRRVQPWVDLDMAMLAVMGREELRSADHLEAGFNSYALAIDRELGDLLGPVPFACETQI